VREVRETRMEADGSQLDGAVVEISAGSYNVNVAILVLGDGVRTVSPVAGAFESGVLDDGQHYLLTDALVIDVEINSDAGSGPHVVTVEFDTEINEST
jgi:hypothetical protein